MKTRNIMAVAALATAILLSAASFFYTNTITANMLILIAQFLVYSLTMAGLGATVHKILSDLNITNRQT